MHKQTLVILDIPREEYFVFRAGMPPDPRMPLRHEDWLKESLHTEHVHRSAGWSTKRVTVHWDDFLAYARKSQLRPSYALLQVYAIHFERKTRGKGE